jgi:Putative DNA-binding domain
VTGQTTAHAETDGATSADWLIWYDSLMLTHEEILLRLANIEDNFVERKTQNDLRDCLKTVVAFANSTPVSYPAIMFVGVKDTGEIEGVSNPDKIQKSVSEKIAPAYPPIYYVTRVLSKDGKQFLAVIILGSENRPHFAGQAFIRDGSQSVVASEDQFRTLITQRNSKAYEILKWKGKEVTVEIESPNPWAAFATFGGVKAKDTQISLLTAIIVNCTQFYVTLQQMMDATEPVSFPLSAIEISFDHKNARLLLLGLKMSEPCRSGFIQSEPQIPAALARR